MAAVKDRLMQLEQAYSFLRDPEIGMAIDLVKCMETRIEALEAALREIAALSDPIARKLSRAALAGEKKDE